jgi:hypothetical protein
MLDDMLVVSVIFHVGEVLGSKHVMWCKTLAQNISDEEHVNIL